MVIAYQIGIFLIIVISSFFGFRALLISVICVVGFSLTNIFTLTLLMVQMTTIAVSTAIGMVIATIRLFMDMPRLFCNFRYWLSEKIYSLRNSSKSFLLSFIFVNFLRYLLTWAFFIVCEFLVPGGNMSSAGEIMEMIMGGLFIGYFYSIIFIGRKINYESDSLIEKGSLTSFLVACGSMYLAFSHIQRFSYVLFA